MRCSGLNRFGTMCAHINYMTILVGPINYQIEKVRIVLVYNLSYITGEKWANQIF